MGYDTSFIGRLTFNRELTIQEKNWYEAIFADEVEGARLLGGRYSKYCQWEITKDGMGLHAEGEKFYEYIEWMKVVLDMVLAPWGIVANGEIEWDGEEQGDAGLIVVEDNLVKVKRKKLVWAEDNE
jgi:hypothetical protein